jgi:cbb3-type cytochrome oxidase maturation protein
MSVLYVALPVALLIAAGALAAFAWSLQDGQLDDLDTPPYRAIYDDVPRHRGSPERTGPEPTAELPEGQGRP